MKRKKLYRIIKLMWIIIKNIFKINITFMIIAIKIIDGKMCK